MTGRVSIAIGTHRTTAHAALWFGSSDYWRGQVDMLREQIEAMGEEPLIA
ncbi:MAG: hypothetical protein JSS01_05640 [Proteobacteria bacterium]|nr:hypothetical protein [Pseudomonadota bacterium]